jgi:hypothetical protein
MNAVRQLEILLGEIAPLSPAVQTARILDFLRCLAGTLESFEIAFLVAHFREQGSTEASKLADVLELELAHRRGGKPGIGLTEPFVRPEKKRLGAKPATAE